MTTWRDTYASKDSTQTNTQNPLEPSSDPPQECLVFTTAHSTANGCLTRPQPRRKITTDDRHLEESLFDDEAALHRLGGPRLRVSTDGGSNAKLCPMFAELEFFGQLFSEWDGKPTKLFRAVVVCIVCHSLCMVVLIVWQVSGYLEAKEHATAAGLNAQKLHIAGDVMTCAKILGLAFPLLSLRHCLQPGKGGLLAKLPGCGHGQDFGR